MKKILIVSLFGDPLSDNNSRLNNIYDYIEAKKLIITADFGHGQKAYRNGENYRNVKYIHVPPYTKNLGFKRIYSHICFAYYLWKYLRKMVDKPDVIYCAMPTSSAAVVCSWFCKKHNVTFVIDVVDLWPDSLMPISKWFKVFRFILYPWKCLTIIAYKNADIILGESVHYVNVARKYNSSVPAYPIYLGIDCDNIEKLKVKSEISLQKNGHEIWICYGGSLGNSYDFDVLLEAVEKLNRYYDYKLLFVGGGENQLYIEKKIEKLKLNAIITGVLSYQDYLKYLSYCDIGINIFKKDTFVIHSYKFNDYVASGLFILNSLEGETAEMIEQYHVGLNFNFDDNPLDKVLQDVCKNWDYYKNYRLNCNRLIDEKMEKGKIYKSVLCKVIN